MIAPNSCARKGEKERGEEGNVATQSAPCVKKVAWGFVTRGLRMVAAFRADIPVYSPTP